MKKLNKKGFTLIEMLVVIAIIAILVAIIIPVVTSATTKAAYATNAANLRSYKAEVSTIYLSDKTGFSIAADGTVTVPTTANITTPTLKKTAGFDPATNTVKVTYDHDKFVVTAGDYTIDDFSIGAETGTLGTTHK